MFLIAEKMENFILNYFNMISSYWLLCMLLFMEANCCAEQIFYREKQTERESASMVVVKRKHIILFHAHLLLEFPRAGSKPSTAGTFKIDHPFRGFSVIVLK